MRDLGARLGAAGARSEDLTKGGESVADLKRHFFRGWLVVAVSCFGAAGCGGANSFDYGDHSEGPGGRHQDVALSAQQEVKLGDEAFQEVLAKEQPVPGPAKDRVQTIGEKIFIKPSTTSRSGGKSICATATPTALPRTLTTANMWYSKKDAINAFCLPGGKIAVYTGLIELTKDNDAWLATVMGHEIAHALAHHASERIAREQMYGRASDATASLTALNLEDRAKLLDLLGLGREAPQYAGDQPQAAAQPDIFAQLRDLSFDRQQESEADHIGVFLMAFADNAYDPEQAVAFWHAMEERTGDQGVPEILSDHPSDQRRIDQLKHWAVRAKTPGRMACGTHRPTDGTLTPRRRRFLSLTQETQHMSYGYGPGGPMLGSGGFFGNVGPQGPYGAWPTCGCSSIFMILAGILLVFAGCSGMLGFPVGGLDLYRLCTGGKSCEHYVERSSPPGRSSDWAWSASPSASATRPIRTTMSTASRNSSYSAPLIPDSWWLSCFWWSPW